MDCNICFEPFDQGGHLPKALPCGHTVCLACLQPLQRLQNWKCPTCQQVIQVPLSLIPNNYTVLQFLQDRPDMIDRAPSWCSTCSTVVTPQCRGQQHVVLRVRVALEQLLQGALPQVAGHLARLKNQCQQEKAVQALTLLSCEAWEVTLRGKGLQISGTMPDTKDPLTKTFLLFLATKGDLNAAATLPIAKSICTRVLDCQKDLCPTDLAGNLLVFSGVQRLLNVSTEVAPHLPIAEPTVQQLSLIAPLTLTALRAALALSRLKRLRVKGGVSFREEVSAADDSLSQGLTDAQARLQWLDLIDFPCDLLPLLLPAHRLTLQVLQLYPGVTGYKKRDKPLQATNRMHPIPVKEHLTCNQLLSLLAKCDLRALKKLVLEDVLLIDHFPQSQAYNYKDDCVRQRGMLLAALPAGAQVLCWKCDMGCTEVF